MGRKAVARTLYRTPWLREALRDRGKYFRKELLAHLLLPPSSISALDTLDKRRHSLSAQLGLRKKASWSEIDQEVRRRLAQTWQKAGIPINREPSWKELGENFIEFHEREGLNKHIFTEDLMLVMYMDEAASAQERC